MTNDEKELALYDDLDSTVARHCTENDLSLTQVLGVLELLKLTIHNDVREDEDDESDTGGERS